MSDREANGGRAAEARPGGGALAVAAGIFASRILGLVRESAVAFVFGVGPHADVWRTALRAPNALQNLLGEQTLSATMIPIYSRLLAEEREEEAGRFAGADLRAAAGRGGGAGDAGGAVAPALVALLTPGFLADAAKVAAGRWRSTATRCWWRRCASSSR